MSSSSPRHPLPAPLTQAQRAFHVADQRFRTLARVCDHFPVSERASVSGKGFSPEYTRAIDERDRASLDLTRARSAMVSEGLRRMGTV